MKNCKSKVVFKDYNHNQNLLFPPSFDSFIEQNHPVRVVNKVIDSINAKPLLEQYKGGGTSSYHPRMLLKILIYSYLQNIYSSRKMEFAVKENIHLMWLSGMSFPDHNTINRFRSERLKNVLKEIFAQVVTLLIESGHLSLQEVYVDGTKIESKANRYSFVWGNAIKTNKAKMLAQLQELWDYSQRIAKEEQTYTEKVEFDQVDAEKVEHTINQIDKVLKGKEVDKKIKQKLNYARKHWPENLRKYKEHEKILGKRNSYSKTDPDATFMRMKEDHMKNGQLKPGYNVQISTNNQFIVNYSLHQNPTDTTTLPSHLRQIEKLYKKLPKAVVTDAGYGSEENYSDVESLGIEPYIKYNYFQKDQLKKKESLTDNLYHNKEQDCYYCPMGQKMQRINSRYRITDNGYKQEYARYKAVNCSGCPLRAACNKHKENWVLEVNHKLQKYKAQAIQLLNSEQGRYYRSKRGVDVEPVFANIKSNKGFRRFLLSGLSKTEIEFGLLALAHNLKKWAA